MKVSAWWFLGALVIAGGLGVALAVRADLEIEQAMRRARELERTAASQRKIIAAQRTNAQELREEITELEGQLAELEGVAGRVEIREVLRVETEEVEIPVPMPSEAEKLPETRFVPVQPRLRFEVLDARAESVAGNVFALGKLDVWRTWPAPEELVHTEEWQTDVGQLMTSEPEPARAPSWGLGPAVGIGPDGGLAGLAVAPPAWKPRIWRWQPEVTTVFSAMAGRDDWQVSAAAVLRF